MLIQSWKSSGYLLLLTLSVGSVFPELCVSVVLVEIYILQLDSQFRYMWIKFDTYTEKQSILAKYTPCCWYTLELWKIFLISVHFSPTKKFFWGSFCFCFRVSLPLFLWISSSSSPIVAFALLCWQSLCESFRGALLCSKTMIESCLVYSYFG